MSYGEKNGVQARLAFYALGAGFLMGALYALLMGLRRLTPHSVLLTAAEDVLFCVTASLATFLFLLECCDGTVRLYLILSEASGFLTVRTAAAEIIAGTRKIIAKKPKKACKRVKK